MLTLKEFAFLMESYVLPVLSSNTKLQEILQINVGLAKHILVEALSSVLTALVTRGHLPSIFSERSSNQLFIKMEMTPYGSIEMQMKCSWALEAGLELAPAMKLILLSDFLWVQKMTHERLNQVLSGKRFEQDTEVSEQDTEFIQLTGG